ncbi:MAG: molybdopterin-dependent oxidoreductase [Chloroflexi bacterium]|nr:molybdopterin-dependent oxidoreductase [Chloroflexota bacterium]
MSIGRRTFLKLAGTTVVGATLLPNVSIPLPSPQPEAPAAAEEPAVEDVATWVPSVCLQCDGGCGIMVRVIDGRAIKIEGNPSYPVNRGKLCPKGQAALQVLYDPDRIKWPMQRVGERGQGQWRRIAWPEALNLVASRLNALRGRGAPQSLMVWSGRTRGQMGTLLSRFTEAFGSPNYLENRFSGADAALKAHYLATGINELPAYDLSNTSYLLSFGVSFAEAWRPTVSVLRAFGHMRRGTPGRRSKIVQIDPRFSPSAAKADEWIPIQPGTDALLALSIAHVIIKEKLYDDAFLKDSVFGFQDWRGPDGQKHMGYTALVLDEYAPSAVAERTGVSADDITRLAREFATHRPALAVAERGVSGHTNGLFSHLAIQSLNALVGSVGATGGVIAQEHPPLAALQPLKLDEAARKGLGNIRVDRAGTSRFPLADGTSQGLADGILRQDPYLVDTLLLYYTNPLFSQPGLTQFHQAFQKIPFIVSFSPFMDESSQYADLILPDCTFLERLQDDEPPPHLGSPVLGLRQPVVTPLYDTANTGDVLILLARMMGGAVGAAFPWRNFEEMLRQRLAGLPATSTSPAGTDWERLRQQGGWWDPGAAKTEGGYPFTTPSKKFELYAQLMQRGLQTVADAGGQNPASNPGDRLDNMLSHVGIGAYVGIAAQGDKAFLPHYESAHFAGDEKEYPLYLNTYKSMALAEGRGGNEPWLLEVFGPALGEKWTSWIEINPETARRLGIADKDQVWMESAFGRIPARARLFAGARPDTVNMPFGFGHRAYGRWAKDRGANPNWILASDGDPLAGLVGWSATRVKVYRA